ncbi:hypothetical protein PF007_g29938 [Phytophthora fragariae]|uniref:SWIM-type domain-containing protein n=1 Tax=Phytophthora fragariae TaxID=53985 RepID=A0A6A3PQE0_9STRA|nr:hypothetical protein PF007_g29938 [Phytophthora fragariae]
MGVDECIETLLFLETAAEMEYASKFNVVGSRLYHDCDEQLSKVAAVVSPHAFQLIRNEYDLHAQNVGAYVAREVQTSIFEVVSSKTSSVYHINAKIYSCSCTFMRTQLLPCHHVMYLRRHTFKKSAIPISHINNRWVVSAEANRPVEEVVASQQVHSTFKVLPSHLTSAAHEVLNGSTKWRAAMDIASRVVETLSRQGTSTFREMCDALKTFDDLVTKGIVPRYASVEDDGRDDGCEGSAVDLTGGEFSSCPPTLHSNDEAIAAEVTTSALPSEEAVAGDIRTDGNKPLTEVTNQIVRSASNSTTTIQDGALTNELVSDVESKKPPKKKTTKSVKTPEGSLQIIRATSKSKRKSRSEDTYDIEGDDEWGLLSALGLHDENENSNTSAEEDMIDPEFEPAFKIASGIVSKGRPKIKRAVKIQAKSKRMKASTEEATRLVLGTLVPVKDLRAVRTTIAEAFNVFNAMPVLGSLKEIPAPPWKSTRFVIFSKSRPSILRMAEVFPEAYVKKCIAGINMHRKSLSLDMQQTISFGVKITAVGTIKEGDVKTMEGWHRCSRILEAMTETFLWIRSCKFDRISLPTPFNDCVDVDLCAFTSELEEWNLGETSDSIFGPIERHELQRFIRDHWFQDSSFRSFSAT